MRFSTRSFPDVAQAGLAALTVLNQSRVVFSGPRGTVLLVHNVFYDITALGANETVAVGSVGTAVGINMPGNVRALPVVAGNGAARVFTVLQDPALNTFIEANVDPLGSTLTIPAGASRLGVFSFPHDAGDGPVVTLS